MLFLVLCLLALSFAAPVAADEVDDFLAFRNRYYVLVAATGIKNSENPLSFVTVDAEKIEARLEQAGYKALEGLPPLIGKEATRENIDRAKNAIRGLGNDAIVLFYYTGHGYTDETRRELYLQLYDQETIGEDGYEFSDLAKKIRNGPDGYKGDLVFLIDACFSGSANIGTSIERTSSATWVITSSSASDKSFPISYEGVQISAFTAAVLLAASDSEFTSTDGNEDGIIEYDELFTKIDSTLAKWSKDKDSPLFDRKLVPHREMQSGSSSLYFVHNPEKARKLDSPFRVKVRWREVYPSYLAAADSIVMLNTSTSTAVASPTIEDDVLHKALSQIGTENNPLANGWRTLRDKKYSEALEYFRKNVEDVPRQNSYAHWQAELLLARAYAYVGQETEALKTYSKIMSDTAPTDTKIEYASVLHKVGHLGKAERIYLAITSDREKKTSEPILVARAYNNLGVLRTTQAREPEAVITFNNARSSVTEEPVGSAPIHPVVDQAIIYRNLGLTYRRQGEYAKAAEAFEVSESLKADVGAIGKDLRF